MGNDNDAGKQAQIKRHYFAGPINRAVVAMFACLALTPANAQLQKQLRFNVAGSEAGVSITNAYGAVHVSPSPGSQVLVTTTTYSDKAKIESSQNGNRIQLRTRLPQRTSENEGRVEYEVQVPANANITIQSATGPVRIEKLTGDLTIEGESAQVEVRDLTGAHVHIRTVSGPIALSGVTNSFVDVTSVAGSIVLNSVSGRKVAVNTSSGSIRYNGDFGSAGEYSFMNHIGNIDVVLPASASVEINARSVTGNVQNDFPFRPKPRSSAAAAQEHSFAGTSNAGESSVRLSSFGGTITVKKQ